MIISFLNQKGGVGKTTLSINLAYALKDEGAKVLLVDADNQGSTRDWHAQSGGDLLTVIALDRSTIDKDVREFRSIYDYIIIDGSPNNHSIMASTIKCSDIVLIPVQPSALDIWASAEVIEAVKLKQELSGKPKVSFIISRAIKQTKISKEIAEILQGYEIPIFNSCTTQKVIYSDSLKEGKTVLHYKNQKARDEIIKIKNELLEFLDA